jgi:Cu2+-containing amine oxidase
MALDRLKQAASHITGIGQAPHPFDPLSEQEIERAVAIIRKEHSDVFFNAITLWEPRKVEMMQWLKDPQHTPRPHRVADVVCIGRGSKVYDGHADLTEGKIVSWALTDDVQPLVSSKKSSESTTDLLMVDTDHHGRSANRRVYRTERCQGHRAMRPDWHSTRRHAQGVLRP